MIWGSSLGAKPRSRCQAIRSIQLSSSPSLCSPSSSHRIRSFASLPSGATAEACPGHHLLPDGFCSVCGSKLARPRTGENVGVWGFLAVLAVAALLIFTTVPALGFAGGIPYDAYYSSHGYSGTITPPTPPGWQINSTAVYREHLGVKSPIHERRIRHKAGVRAALSSGDQELHGLLRTVGSANALHQQLVRQRYPRMEQGLEHLHRGRTVSGSPDDLRGPGPGDAGLSGKDINALHRTAASSCSTMSASVS